jgi:hypothetical protein
MFKIVQHYCFQQPARFLEKELLDGKWKRAFTNLFWINYMVCQV